ncbi:MAG: glycosyltransferase [Lachnospiraceae bacterium]|nr:glycosyltransferase [Lachnospiraceae bacterium]
MNILIFTWQDLGIKDVCEALDKTGDTYRCVTSEYLRERVSPEFDSLFERVFDEGRYDCVFTFNFSPVLSHNCNRRNIPYIAVVYDSPLVQLYSCALINPCNYIFVFDKTLYQELKQGQISTVYYAPLAVNTERIARQLKCLDAPAEDGQGETIRRSYTCDVSFLGSLYQETHNFFDRLENLSPYVKGYLDAVMAAQKAVCGQWFVEELLTPEIVDAMQKSLAPAKVVPNPDGVETVSWIFANVFLARKIAATERQELLAAASEHFDTWLYTPGTTSMLPRVRNRGPVDYYRYMPFVFACSRINLNITLRSIRSAIPLRAMDIMGAGGFLLSNYQSEFYDFFVPGEDMEIFYSKEDMLQKCRYYLSHDAERRQIAANGHGKVKEKHTFEIRLKEIFSIVFG